MREPTIRRLLVLVLCASGIVALWILADRSLSTPDAAHSDTSEPNSRSGSRAASPIRSDVSQHGVPSRGPAGPPPPAASRQPGGHPGAQAGSRRRPQSQRDPAADRRPPAVKGLHVIDNNHDSITVRWNPVHDPTVAYYHVTLNGIPVGDTAGRQLTIDWFNDDMTSHFILVRAVDVGGARGHRGYPLVVTRPDEPAAKPSPGRPPAADPTPDRKRERTPDPGTSPTPQPSPSPTTRPAVPPSPAPGSPGNPPSHQSPSSPEPTATSQPH